MYVVFLFDMDATVTWFKDKEKIKINPYIIPVS